MQNCRHREVKFLINLGRRHLRKPMVLSPLCSLSTYVRNKVDLVALASEDGQASEILEITTNVCSLYDGMVVILLLHQQLRFL